ncbi:MAG: dTMP kinase [Actinobacteria bacterium]|nr:dTMP kinase [Actinomycetota bacterium]
MAGLFITFEGGDGSGKSTQIAMLAERLRALGHDVRSFREPGGVAAGDAGERIRDILLDPVNADLGVRAELLLYEASRAQLTEQHYRPALDAGAIVLCDRYADSSVAYQGYGRAVLPVAEVQELNRIATGGLVPDLTLLLDVDAASGLAQATSAGADRLEAAGREFHERVREGYLEIARAEPGRVKVIGRAPVEQVADEIWSHVQPLLSRIGRE